MAKKTKTKTKKAAKKASAKKGVKAKGTKAKGTKKVKKSAKTGKFVSDKFAKSNPNTTVQQTVSDGQS